MLIGPQNLAENLARVRSRIAAAAHAAGRHEDSVTLIAVTKAQPPDTVRAARALGLEDFGENYPQEALAKIEALGTGAARWHFIGQVQSNKTRPIATHFAWVHSLERLAIARRLNEQRPFHGPPLNVCLQVKLADEPAKAGVAPEELQQLADAVAALPRLKLRGLMCIPPALLDEAQQRGHFRRLRELLEGLRAAGHDVDCLSMGMSADYELAIAEGATHVRVGTALFGPRPASTQ